jgi:hypothetical protein
MGQHLIKENHMGRRLIPIETRFWANVTKTDGNLCWQWSGSRDKDGYGVISESRSNGHPGKMLKAHRYSWSLHFGPIPDGLQVLHECDNPGCTRPGHLFLGTTLDNNRDKVRKGRQRHGENHHKTKLTDAQVHEIIRLYATGNYSQTALGQMFGIAQTGISGIINGKRAILRYKDKVDYK